MRRLIVLSALLAVVLCSTCAYGADKGKYQDLFYPNGMPVKEGEKGQTFYKYYSEAEISEDNLLFVLYSEKKEDNPFSPFNAYLATIRKSGSALKVISTMRVSKYAFPSEDDRETFNHMSGKLEVIPLKDNLKLLHLSIGGYFTPGAGHSYSSDSSDVFFRIDTSNNKLLPALELLDTSPYEYTGEMSYEKYSKTFLYMRKGKNTGTEILTQKYTYENNADENIHTSVLEPEINAYTYDFNNDKFILTNKISKLPSDATAIGKGYENYIKDPYENINPFGE